jgi:hypothetical protein
MNLKKGPQILVSTFYENGRYQFPCEFCKVANAASHWAQQIIGALSTDKPFNIISMDIWHPGMMTSMSKGNRFQKAILTCLCNMTGFASLAFVSHIDSNMMARSAFSHFFIANGLPRLVLIDKDSAFKGYLMTMCDILGVRYIIVWHWRNTMPSYAKDSTGISIRYSVLA